jgi:hypothetical protein
MVSFTESAQDPHLVAQHCDQNLHIKANFLLPKSQSDTLGEDETYIRGERGQAVSRNWKPVAAV